MNKENKKELVELAMKKKREKITMAFPTDYIPKPKYNDDTTNGLTKCVLDFLNFQDKCFAERISSTGRYVAGKTRINYHENKVVKEGKWIKGSGTKGTADISATIKGKAIKIEIKFGKDRQSMAQKEYQRQTVTAGGIYLIVKNYDDFREWYNSYLESVSKKI